MKYFKNIHSLSELKKQFRALALANHPDRGGNTETMQEINAEFDAMFAVLKSRPETVITEAERQETGSTYRRHFYTANGWEGSRYDSALRTTDISARVKVYTKERYPEYKFSVRTEYYSGGSSIHLKLVSGPVEAFQEDAPRNYVSTMGQLHECFKLTAEVYAVLSDVVAYCNSYNYDDSDGMTDYFDTNFYLHIYVGEYGKPYEVKQPRAKKVSGKAAPRAERIEAEAVEAVAPTCNNPEAVAVLMVDYSEKAVAVIGDTAAIKDDLKALGGRFNPRLTVEGQKVAGWIFSKTKEAEVLAYIKKLNESGTAEEAAEPIQQPEAEAVDDIAAGLEVLQGLSQEGIFNCLMSASDTLRQSPEFWKMINSGDNPAEAIGKTALACLLTLGRKIKQGAA